VWFLGGGVCVILLVYQDFDAMDGEFIDKLRTVFSVCDVHNEGYITVDHFKNLAKEHFSAGSSDEVSGDLLYGQAKQTMSGEQVRDSISRIERDQ
jgi:Ca2+-binding EF-hand superfamily protein